MGRKRVIRSDADKIKSILITKTAIKELTSEDIVERVIQFQFKDFRDMVYEHDQIEISGFGKFLVSPVKVEKEKIKANNCIKKAKRKLETEPDASLSKREYWEYIVRTYTALLEDLESRTNGYENKH